jgi:hypothetical protein
MRNRASTILKASALRAHMHRRPPSVLHTKALESGNTLRLARPVMILAPILGAVGLDGGDCLAYHPGSSKAKSMGWSR